MVRQEDLRLKSDQRRLGERLSRLADNQAAHARIISGAEIEFLEGRPRFAGACRPSQKYLRRPVKNHRQALTDRMIRPVVGSHLSRLGIAGGAHTCSGSNPAYALKGRPPLVISFFSGSFKPHSLRRSARAARASAM